VERDRYEYSSLFSVCEEFSKTSKREKKASKKGQKSVVCFPTREYYCSKTLNKTLRITANETPSSESEKV
jgi:hypothetical protein